MSAKPVVKRCPSCGYHVLRAYFPNHVCRPGDVFVIRQETALERAQKGKR